MTGFRVTPGHDGVVYVSGELDMAVADGFGESVMWSCDPQRDVVLDVEQLGFIDSTGIRALLDVARRVRPAPLVVRSPRPNVANVLEIVNIEALGVRVEHGARPG